MERAKEIVNQLSANDITETVKNISVETASSNKKKKEPHLDEVDLTQMSLFTRSFLFITCNISVAQVCKSKASSV